MNRLLIANFMRIKKNKLFWALCGVMALVSLTMVVNLISNNATQIDGAANIFVIPAEIAAAIFISVFFGTEYGDGTIRNKLIAGHDRRQIYFANAIMSTVCAFAMFVSYMLPVMIFGFSFVGLPTGKTIGNVAVGIVTLFAFCSIFTMVSMIYSNKTGATVINIVIAFLLLLAALILTSYLTIPEFYPSYGMGESMSYVRNPNYVSGIKRTVLQILVDLLPSGHSIQFIMGVSRPLWALSLYVVGVCTACSIVGAVVFSKKDIK